jgi:hypothetical protein
VNFLTEDQNGMSRILKTEWTIIPTTAPQPWIACSTCGGSKPFRCSDRLRLNANGKRLDAWLIYRCSTCDKTWNRTLFERRNVRNIDPSVLAALQSNDADWIRMHAFHVDGLRRHAQRIDEFADAEVRKTLLSHAEDWSRLEIELRVPVQASIRLDRLLSSELGLSRTRLQALDQARRLEVEPHRKAALRRPPGDGMRMILDLSGEPDRLTIADRASGRGDP